MSFIRNSSQDDKTKLLMDFTNTSQKEAQRLLRHSNWDVNSALNLYYEQASTKKPSNKPKASSSQTKAIQEIFNKYEDPDKKGWITVDGTMELCQDLGIDPTQLDFLLLSYHLGSKHMGEFSRQEFVEACLSLHCDSVAKLKHALTNDFQNNLKDVNYFRNIYNYAFLFGRQTGQKNLALDAAVELWKLLLAGRYDRLDQWITFLEEKHRKAISRDTWTLFLDFATQPNFDIDTHDAEGAWPILIDEFVEYLKNTSSNNISNSISSNST
ncbi:Cullin binding-domain-containing protein [Halteromyces radiatus]|uniref:Cullin binding-domain-containing protein n=1 Tax=Halteromyces radiatus TaxID=101107 RepID=UPI00221FBEC4|nr:Cullin binding-domain-containing protein [Halteromyces radiatus]KAI8097523.1 Cullin binding-domain-containing protein [Halteromyces radiatus]